MKSKNKKRIPNVFEKAFVAWLKYDILVTMIVKNDDILRKQVMLNLLGKHAAKKYYGHIEDLSIERAIIFPETVRQQVEASLHDQEKRNKVIQKLVYWATDPVVNNAYIDSHLARIQIVRSLLGPMFFHATKKQNQMILKGLKYMLVHKKTVVGEKGEQSPDVHRVLLDKISDLLIHNQKVIINKAIQEAEEKMRVNLIRQIQELSGEKHSAPIHSPDLKAKVKTIVKEKFPLDEESKRHLEEMLEFYRSSNWDDLLIKANESAEKIQKIRKPFTLTQQEPSR